MEFFFYIVFLVSVKGKFETLKIDVLGQNANIATGYSIVLPIHEISGQNILCTFWILITARKGHFVKTQLHHVFLTHVLCFENIFLNLYATFVLFLLL